MVLLKHRHNILHLTTITIIYIISGRQPFRTGLVGPSRVLQPHHSGGLPHDEITIAEALQDKGYKTGIVGKWHQGINLFTSTDGLHLPHTQGFDFVGTILPFSLYHFCDTSKVIKLIY